MAKYVSFFIGFSVLCTAYALHCYNCATTDAQNKSCEDLKNIQSTLCGNASPGYKPACVKSVFKEKPSQVTNVTRRCVVLPNDGNTDDVCKIQPTQEKIFCEVCFEDNCNGSTRIDVNVFTMLGAVVSLLVTKFFLH